MVKRFWDDIDPTPETVTDERVQITRSVTISGSTYYEGWLFGLTDAAIQGAQTDVGAWTATGKGGTQYDVILDGLPGAEEVLLDLNSGRVITNSSVLLYFRYNDYSRVYSFAEIGERIIQLTGRMDCASETTALDKQTDYPTRLTGVRVVSKLATSADVTFNIKNTTASTSDTVTISNGDTEGQADFSTPIEFQRLDNLRITANTNSGGAVDPIFYFLVG